MQRASCISGSIQVLRARVAEIDRFRINDGAVRWLRFVVDDCCVGPGGRYRIKGQANEVFVLSIQMIVSVTSSCLRKQSRRLTIVSAQACRLLGLRQASSP